MPRGRFFLLLLFRLILLRHSGFCFAVDLSIFLNIVARARHHLAGQEVKALRNGGGNAVLQ